jgi:hypothetical protein
MSKGFFSQGVAVLFEREPTLEALEAALANDGIVKRTPPAKHWAFGGPGLLLSPRPDVNGYVVIDVVGAPWPDAMGDPKNETAIFGAWSMGHFGPFAYPGGLTRAAAQAWHWEQASATSARHQAFVRIRSSYAPGARLAGTSSGRELLTELFRATELSQSVLSVPDALCHFNPAGEVLSDRELTGRILERHRTSGPVALELWTNVRLFSMGGTPNWILMDTVGMTQLESKDQEACFEAGRYEPSDVASFLRNVSFYILAEGPIVADGDTTDGPGGVRWQATAVESGLADPPRAMLRWLPLDDAPRPEALRGQPPASGKK